MLKVIIKYSLIIAIVGIYSLIIVKEQRSRDNLRFFSYLCAENGSLLTNKSYVIYFNPECDICNILISQINDFEKVLLISPADSSTIENFFKSNGLSIPSDIFFDKYLCIGEYLSIENLPTIYKLTDTKAYPINAISIADIK